MTAAIQQVLWQHLTALTAHVVQDGYRPVDLAVGGHHTDIVEYLNDVDTAVQYTKIAQYSKYL